MLKIIGIPQNRERVYTISIRKDIETHTFEFPSKQELKLRLKDMLEEEVEEKYYLSNKIVEGFIKHNERHKQKGTGFIWKPKDIEQYATAIRSNAALCPTDNTIIVTNVNPSGNGMNGNVFSVDGLSPTLTTNKGEGIKVVATLNIKGQDCIKRVYGDIGISPTLTNMQGGNRQPKILESNYRIRKLTPKECWRLMGFNDTDGSVILN